MRKTIGGAIITILGVVGMGSTAVQGEDEVPVAGSPMVMVLLTFTTPPLAIVSVPAPPVLPPPTARMGPPTFQVDPVPVTVTAGVPEKASISAPDWLLSTPGCANLAGAADTVVAVAVGMTTTRVDTKAMIAVVT